ncbi:MULTISPECIES: GGDEF domain-containing protein [Modicisalibacter]|uniref:GGDEF domain-containing protein n=1 Tax=Modicisalibacter TaxID=574347 RepID=UPI0013968359|nr:MULTISPECIES: GGDEF domain-containing protein [Halomonadaceae]MBZ9556626.1 GGDEF domain-containing protein [Modicisalibacter sp. R2A 31.J]MBZ9574905.1 GGDEF domain-containing protein [Modicisalibacter sp. MOD 31.J]
MLFRVLPALCTLFLLAASALWLLARADDMPWISDVVTGHRLAFLTLLLAGFVTAIWLVVRQLFTRPIHELVDYVRSQHEGVPEAAPSHLLSRHDDIAYLTREIEHLLETLRSKNEQLLAETLNDPLTGLGNRRLLEQRLEIALPLSRRRMTPLSALMIDVDHFKQYNDHYGHPAGDECLKEIANVLRDIFRRETDIVVRLGGEEFLVVLLDNELDDATRLAEAMRSMLQAVGIPHEHSPTAEVVTVSIGVATAPPGTPIDLDSLLACADSALYRCKATGRNCTVSHTVGVSPVPVEALRQSS